jgi:hypothetical protein
MRAMWIQQQRIEIGSIPFCFYPLLTALKSVAARLTVGVGFRLGFGPPFFAN